MSHLQRPHRPADPLPGTELSLSTGNREGVFCRQSVESGVCDTGPGGRLRQEMQALWGFAHQARLLPAAWGAGQLEVLIRAVDCPGHPAAAQPEPESKATEKIKMLQQPAGSQGRRDGVPVLRRGPGVWLQRGQRPRLAHGGHAAHNLQFRSRGRHPPHHRRNSP